MASLRVSDPSTRGDGLLSRFCGDLGSPRLYQRDKPARAGSQLVPAGTYRDRRLRSGPGLAMRAGTTRPGARAYTTITAGTGSAYAQARQAGRGHPGSQKSQANSDMAESTISESDGHGFRLP